MHDKASLISKMFLEEKEPEKDDCPCVVTNTLNAQYGKIQL